MAGAAGLLSDRWHLVAGLRVTLRPDCVVRRQTFRGETWQVISDPYSNRHYRVRPEAWQFLARLNRRRTVDESWREMVDHSPASAPGQREVIEVLTQLHGANLLLADAAPETWSMVDRRQREQRRQARQQWMNFLFLRIPLFDPDFILERLKPIGRLLLSPLGVVLWVVVLSLGGKAVIDHWTEFREQSQGVLAPANLVWLYLVWSMVKVAHEFGHGMMTKRFGGEVRSCGVMLLVFTPVPFVDASAAWAFRARWQRLLVGAGGMIFELFIAAIAAMVWAQSDGEGTVARVAYNVVFLASVSTLLFNANPLLRFDGYYILADWVGVPNLQRQASQQWNRWFERWGLGLDGPSPLARTRAGAAGLGAFGAACAGYRVFVLLVICAFIAGQLFEVGFVFALVGLVLWLGGPLLKFFNYLLSAPRTQRARKRAVGWAIALPVVVLGILSFVPMPHAVRAPGVVTGARVSEVHADVSGRLDALLVASGEYVETGAVLVTLRNPELTDLREELEAVQREVMARRALAWDRMPAVLEPLDQRLRSIEAQLREIDQQLAALAVRAPQSGRWSAPGMEWRVGSHVPRGTLLGRVSSRDDMVFDAVVAQRDVDRLTRSQTQQAELRLRGAADTVIETGPGELRPAESRRLPSAALGWRAGGTVRIDPDDPDGLLAAEPFFRLRVALPADANTELLMRTGVLRVGLDWQPWGVQGWRRLRQFVQERYGR
ncbi:efflux RND transporter periplasmic adaptor subunit [Synoicihabitans lomoniglobus]|uniref:Efflux RND transporter periplasmic adaptor subunit n=1 Tax=Synoicihabitans lomoniglobus TaxID=2909285 RepID=A0AAE9ZXL6_9BACT|nr:efflux RND transporter periplasmic adaptor subunit [Opitutaceae bacterium LMO-M01]WED65411.1 efflux RND transporter periplasmic adaptor subunit [Opitutaceae bacterium LMO-M01]